MLTKPDRLQHRDIEWRELSEFAASKVRGATLGLVYGRRRQGKTLMLELLARQSAGFFFGATMQSEAQSLADLGRSLSLHNGLGSPLALASWRDALDEMFRLGEQRPTTVVIDEFPYLASVTPALPSYLQQALSPTGYAKEQSQTRLILCGSALTIMGQLLGGGAPLRGRASLELVVRPFGFREAAAFWGFTDPELAFRVHALVGGTPAYLEMSGGEGPNDRESFDSWVVRRLLNPASAMFREGGLLLREEPSITDPVSYAAVLTALSAGRARRSEIAADLGRPATAISHLLDGLVGIGLVQRVEDALRERRAVYRLAEPVVRLYQLLIQRHEAEIVVGRAADVWARNADTIQSKIYGPHFEDLAREWCLAHAASETLGGVPAQVRPTQIGCPEHKQGHEIDVVVWEARSGQKDRIIAIGEAKATAEQVSQAVIDRLDHLRSLLPASASDEPPRLLVFSRSGFSAAVTAAAAKRTDLELIDMIRLYTGS